MTYSTYTLSGPLSTSLPPLAMYTYTYNPDVHYPYLIPTDVSAEEPFDSYSSSLSPQTPAGQYLAATAASSTHLWGQSEWRCVSCSSMSVFNANHTLVTALGNKCKFPPIRDRTRMSATTISHATPKGLAPLSSLLQRQLLPLEERACP